MNDIEFEKLEAYGNQLANDIRTHDWSTTLSGEVRPIVMQGVRDNFTSSVSPDGKQWPARKHKGDGHPLLIETGKMLQSAIGGGAGRIMQVDSAELVTGVSQSVPYAGIHNAGTRKMPQREFMGVQERRLKQIDEVIANAGEAIFA